MSFINFNISKCNSKCFQGWKDSNLNNLVEHFSSLRKPEVTSTIAY